MTIEARLRIPVAAALREIQASGSLTLAAGDVLARMLGQMAQGSHSHDPRTLETSPPLPGQSSKRREPGAR